MPREWENSAGRNCKSRVITGDRKFLSNGMSKVPGYTQFIQAKGKRLILEYLAWQEDATSKKHSWQRLHKNASFFPASFIYTSQEASESIAACLEQAFQIGRRPNLEFKRPYLFEIQGYDSSGRNIDIKWNGSYFEYFLDEVKTDKKLLKKLCSDEFPETFSRYNFCGSENASISLIDASWQKEKSAMAKFLVMKKNETLSEIFSYKNDLKNIPSVNFDEFVEDLKKLKSEAQNLRGWKKFLVDKKAFIISTRSDVLQENLEEKLSILSKLDKQTKLLNDPAFKMTNLLTKLKNQRLEEVSLESKLFKSKRSHRPTPNLLPDELSSLLKIRTKLETCYYLDSFYQNLASHSLAKFKTEIPNLQEKL